MEIIRGAVGIYSIAVRLSAAEALEFANDERKAEAFILKMVDGNPEFDRRKIST